METTNFPQILKILGYAKIMNKGEIIANKLQGESRVGTSYKSELCKASNDRPKLLELNRSPLPILKIFRTKNVSAKKEENTPKWKIHGITPFYMKRPAPSVKGKTKEFKIIQVKKVVKRHPYSMISSNSALKLKQPHPKVLNYQEAETVPTELEMNGNKLALRDSAEPSAAVETDNLTQKEFCEEILKHLQHKKNVANASPFFEPFDTNEPGVRDYHKIVQNPVNLKTIEAKLTKGKYKSHPEFANDVRLMFTNCYKYYPEQHDKIKEAHDLQFAFEIKYARMPSGPFCQSSLQINENCITSSSSSNPSSSSEDKRRMPRVGELQDHAKMAAKTLTNVGNQMHEKSKRREVRIQRIETIRKKHAPHMSKIGGQRKYLKLSKRKSEECKPSSVLKNIDEEAIVKPMSYSEMMELKAKILKLTGEEIMHVAHLVQTNDSVYNESDSEEVELDLELLKQSTLRDLDAFANSCLKRAAKKEYEIPSTSVKHISEIGASSNIGSNINAFNSCSNTRLVPLSLSSNDSDEDNMTFKKSETLQDLNVLPYNLPTPLPSVTVALTLPPMKPMQNLSLQVEKPNSTTTCKKDAISLPDCSGFSNFSSYPAAEEEVSQDSSTTEPFVRKIEPQLRKSWPWSNLARTDTPSTFSSNAERQSTANNAFQYFRRISMKKSEMQSQTNGCHEKEPLDETERNKDDADSMEDLKSPNSQKEKKGSPIMEIPDSFSSPLSESPSSFVCSPRVENREEMKRLEAAKRRREANTGATYVLSQADIMREFEREYDISYMRVKKWHTS